jgi:hypothetical protein
MSLDKLLDVGVAEPCHLPYADAWQARLFACDMVVNPRLADTKPLCNIGNGQKSLLIVIRYAHYNFLKMYWFICTPVAPVFVSKYPQ